VQDALCTRALSHEPRDVVRSTCHRGASSSAKASRSTKKGGGIGVRKLDSVHTWYEEVVNKAELVQPYPVKGCFTLRPWAYRIWELIQRWLDDEIKKFGVENCYFPMFIPRGYLQKEKDHLNDFAAELAWVTRFGDEDLDVPVAIRPTSETAMYDAFSKWVQSHRDLPIKLNQWCSVVRWEVKQTTPFLRTREFLWQEGHTAHAKRESAAEEVLAVLELYAEIYEKLLAIPVFRGTKTKAETFPGADYTTTVEAFIPATGRAIQGATSHHLGQNFSRMFDISFQGPSDTMGKTRAYAFQNSWGITQRTIGVMIMVHGDDKGLVLPPKVAGFQVVIMPVGIKASSPPEEQQRLEAAAGEHFERLQRAGVRVKFDDRDYTPGWKYNYWEMKGVPLRIEVGPSDVDADRVTIVKRIGSGAKVLVDSATLVEGVFNALEEVHEELYAKALAERDSLIATADEWVNFSHHLNQGKLLLVPFCGEPECEEAIKQKSKDEAAEAEVASGLRMGAKSLCVPHEDKYHEACPPRCIFPGCDRDVGGRRTLFGRSY